MFKYLQSSKIVSEWSFGLKLIVYINKWRQEMISK